MNSYLVSGAGSGIGAAIVRRIANEGHSVILLGRNKNKLQSVQNELPNSIQHEIISVDVRDKNALTNEIKKLNLESLTGVIANAGVGGENIYGKHDRWDEIISTNLTGAYNLVNESLPYLKKDTDSYKNVILISSILARLGVPGYSAYCASKAGMLGLARSWAVEFSRDQILVNAICPGWVETDMAKQGIEAFASHTKKSYKDAFKEQIDMVLLKKMSTPEEVAGLVWYLLSNQQTSFTGQSFDINNGALMPS